MPAKRARAAPGGQDNRGRSDKGFASTLNGAKSKSTVAKSKAKPVPACGDDGVTVHVQKFRFQYMNSKPVSQLEPGSMYWDRVSLSIPCREVWQRVLQDPRFSREAPMAGPEAGRSARTRTFVPLREFSAERLRELALCVWRNMSEQGRTHLGEQYWRARSQSFDNYVKKLARQGETDGSGGGFVAAAAGCEARGEDGERCDRSWGRMGTGVGTKGFLPDPEPLADCHRDPYLMRGVPLRSKNGRAEKEIGGEGGGEGKLRACNYNALRQSQSVSDSPAQFLNSLRCCYAEIAAPKGALLLLRGNSHNQSGKQVLAEYVQHPEEELGSTFWRDADADEALAGYLDAAGRRVAYPWRQRLVRVICPVPKELIMKHGSGGLKKQLNSSKLMKENDAAMLRGYVKEWRKKMEKEDGKRKRRGKTEDRSSSHLKSLGKGTKHKSKTSVSTDAEEGVAKKPPNHKRRKMAPSSSTISSAAASSSATPFPPPNSLSIAHAKPAQPSHPSFQALYDLLEQTHFPKSGQRPNVAGYESIQYLIFGLHRRRGTAQLELTEATRLAYGKLGLEEVEDNVIEGGGEEGTDTPKGAGDEVGSEAPAKPIDATHYHVLLEAVLRHFREVGLGEGACFRKKQPPAPRFRRRPGIRDPLRDKFILAGDVFFTSVMVAKNTRTFMHRDANNKGPSYQVVVSDPSQVDSGEFQGGNLLAWPDIQRVDADNRVAELRDFWELRRRERLARRERMRHINPVNARWTGEGDKVEIDSETGKLLSAKPTQAQPSRLGGDADFDDCNMLEELLLEESGGIGLRHLSDDARAAARRAVYDGYGQLNGENNIEQGEPTHNEDATVVQCVHRYVSFYGKRCFHATQPWTLCANRYCITFFGINLEGGGARHAKLRRQLLEIGFRPHPLGMEDGEGAAGD